MAFSEKELEEEIKKCEAAISSCENGIFINQLVLEGLKKCTSTS